jgi:hypothetical protein
MLLCFEMSATNSGEVFVNFQKMMDGCKLFNNGGEYILFYNFEIFSRFNFLYRLVEG